MKKILLSSMLLMLLSFTSMAQTKFKTSEEVVTKLCQQWANMTVGDNTDKYEFLSDKTFWFTFNNERYFGRWDFDVKTQTISIDYFDIMLFDQEFKINKLTDSQFDYTIINTVGGPTTKSSLEAIIPWVASN